MSDRPPMRVPLNEAARLLSVSRATLERMIARGEIAAVKPGSRVFIPWSEIERNSIGVLQSTAREITLVAGSVAGGAHGARHQPADAETGADGETGQAPGRPWALSRRR